MSHLKTAHVTILSNGMAFVDGNTVAIAQLGKKMKSLGAKGDTTIYVAVPADVSQSTIANVTRSLASAGFPKIVFTKPVERSATVSDTSTSSQSATTTTTIPPAKPTKSTKTKTSTAQKPVRSGTL